MYFILEHLLFMFFSQRDTRSQDNGLLRCDAI